MTSTVVLAVIVNYRTPELAEKCLAALGRERSPELAISAILVDGGSDDGSAQKLSEVALRGEFRDWVEFLPLDFNGGFGWANNQAILHRARSEAGLPEFIYLVNPDAEVMPGALSSLKSIFDNGPNIGVVGSQLVNTDGSHSPSSFRFPSIGREFIRGSDTYLLHQATGIKPIAHSMMSAGPVDWVTGASAMVRREALYHTGLFDDGFFLYFEEVELMHRMKSKGWTVWHDPNSLVKHVGGVSTGITHNAVPKALPSYWYRSRQRFFALSYGRLATFSANIVWLLANYSIRKFRDLVSRRTNSRTVPQEAAGIINAGIWPKITYIVASYPVIQDRPGTLPSWSRRP